MSKLEVKTYPDPVLSQVSLAVEKLTGEDKKFIADLIDTMHEDDGVGIAAPQVGVLKRIIVVCPVAKRGNEKVYINPQILSQEGEVLGLEGCLSVPGVSAEVKRAKKIKVKAQDMNGKSLEFKAEDFEARIFQHEIDHLNGKLFIDRLGFKQRRSVVNDLRELNRMPQVRSGHPPL